ncbi:hypothetical protein CICRMM096B_11830 [Citrobacter cronae]
MVKAGIQLLFSLVLRGCAILAIALRFIIEELLKLLLNFCRSFLRLFSFSTHFFCFMLQISSLFFSFLKVFRINLADFINIIFQHAILTLI